MRFSDKGCVCLQFRGVKAEDLFELAFVSDPQLSPDGSKVVYVQRTINEEKEYESSLYVTDLAAGSTVRLTAQSAKDTSPRWSPDGKSVVFVSDRSGKSQLWFIRVDGGEAEQLTDCKNGATQPVWSPDGRHVLFTTPLGKGDSVEDRARDIEEEERNDHTPRVITRLKYKSDAEGIFKGQHKQLALLHLPSKRLAALTGGAFDHTEACFSPDGTRVAFVANRTADPDRQLISDIFELSLHDRSLTKLTETDGMFGSPQYSPDGRRLSVLGHRLEYKSATLTRVWMIDRETQRITCLTDDWDAEASDAAINDMGTSVENSGAVWSRRGDAVYVLASAWGSTGLYKISLSDRSVSEVCGGERQIYAFSLQETEGMAVIAASDWKTPGDLYAVSLADGSERRLTDVNAAWTAGKVLSRPETLTFPAGDGVMLQGWLMKPADFVKGKKFPLILEIHGGPHTMYSYAFMHEFQVLASRGYGVFYMNPRGSLGYGQSFANAVRGDYGGIDYDDLTDGVNYALRYAAWADGERLGVTGGSYGGFMTNWIVSHTDRFKGAVTQRSICNWLSFHGVSDIGYFFTEWELEGDVVNDADKLWHHSPLRYVSRVNTPLLILHGEKDHRCPIEQAEQLYVALKQQGKPTRFVRFPNANHELSRSGDPSLRVARLREMTAWFDQYVVRG